MKRGFRKGMAAGGCLLGAAALLFCTAGGIPAKIMAERDCPCINVTAHEYPLADAEPLTYFRALSSYGISLRAPAGLEKQTQDGVKAQIYLAPDDSSSVFFLQPTVHGELELPDGADLADETVGAFTEELGKPLNDWYSFYDLMYSMDLDDCNIHSYRKANMFYVFGKMKENLIEFQDHWDWHTEEGDGFIHILDTPENGGKWRVIAEICPKYDRNTCYNVLLTAQDSDTLGSMINSIRLTDETI